MGKINILLISILMIGVLAVMANANVQGIDIDTPIAAFGQNVTGTFEFSGNLTLEGAIPTLYNVSIWAGAAGVGSGSTRVCSNTSLSDTYWSCKVDTSTLNDNQSAIFNVTHGNRTDGGGDNGGENQNSSRVNFLLDNSVPTVSLARLSSLQTDKSGFYPVGCDVNDNVDRNLNVRLNAIDDGSVNTSTQINTEDASGSPINNSLEFPNGEFQTTGLYTLRCTATTSTSLSASGTATFNVGRGDGGAIAVSQAVIQEKQSAISSTTIVIIFVIIAFLLLSVTALYFTMKK